MDKFIQSDKYSEVADLFSSTYAEELGDTEKAQALNEALRKVKSEALDRKIAATEDAGELMKLLKEKQALKH